MDLTNQYARLLETYFSMQLARFSWKIDGVYVDLKTSADTNEQGEPALKMAVVEQPGQEKLKFRNYILLQETETGAKVTSYDTVDGTREHDIERGVLEFDASDVCEAMIATFKFLCGEDN